MIQNYILVLIAVLCNVSAQVSLKKASQTDLFHSTQIMTLLKGAITNYYVIAGVILYMVSFILTIKIYEKFELSFISPLMMAMIFVLIMIASTLFFQEKVGMVRMLGVFVILAGIFIVAKS